jgi:phage shock protein A
LAVLRQYDRQQDYQRELEARLVQLDAEELLAKTPLERAQRATKEAREADKKLEALEGNFGKIEADLEKVRARLEAAKTEINQARANVVQAHDRKAAAVAAMGAEGSSTGADDAMGRASAASHADAVRAAAADIPTADLAAAGWDPAMLERAGEFLAQRLAQSKVETGTGAVPSFFPRSAPASPIAGIKRSAKVIDPEATQKAGADLLNDFLAQRSQLALLDVPGSEPSSDVQPNVLHNEYKEYCSAKKQKQG